MGDEAPRASDGRTPGSPPDGPLPAGAQAADLRSSGAGSSSGSGSGEAVREEGQSGAERAAVAQRVAALALAEGDEDLAELQVAGFAPERTPTLRRLAAAKALIDGIGRALESNTEAAWEPVEAALARLREAADEAAVTDKEDTGRPDLAMLSTDMPPPPEGELPRGVVPPAPGVPRGVPDSDRTAISALPELAEETLVSAIPVDAVVAKLAREAAAAKQAAHSSRHDFGNEATLVEAGMIEDAMSRARELIDRAPAVAPRDSGAPARPASKRGRDLGSASGPPSSEDGGTVQLSYSSLAHGFALTVEEYAALCAERDDDPSRLRALRDRYGIPEVRGHAAVDRYFEQLFTRDPAMKALWQRHYQHYASLVQQRR